MNKHVRKVLKKRKKDKKMICHSLNFKIDLIATMLVGNICLIFAGQIVVQQIKISKIGGFASN